eukprot:TRINITY_DN2753_c0_g1_i2.p1 TRINITY_DN2753_c0_g1~~TRINITY_DN2753_c0_g1_i2.p1  ORF type:complete len:344 (+),score=113.89 TRINITY_DN2753_c0_g1_i2:23-1054(+)
MGEMSNIEKKTTKNTDTIVDYSLTSQLPLPKPEFPTYPKFIQYSLTTKELLNLDSKQIDSNHRISVESFQHLGEIPKDLFEKITDSSNIEEDLSELNDIDKLLFDKDSKVDVDYESFHQKKFISFNKTTEQYKDSKLKSSSLSNSNVRQKGTDSEKKSYDIQAYHTLEEQINYINRSFDIANEKNPDPIDNKKVKRIIPIVASKQQYNIIKTDYPFPEVKDSFVTQVKFNEKEYLVAVTPNPDQEERYKSMAVLNEPIMKKEKPETKLLLRTIGDKIYMHEIEKIRVINRAMIPGYESKNLYSQDTGFYMGEIEETSENSENENSDFENSDLDFGANDDLDLF